MPTQRHSPSGAPSNFVAYKPTGIGMIFIHVRDRPGLGVDQRLRVRNIGEQILRVDVHDAAEAGNQMRAPDLHPVKCKVSEVCKHLGVRMAPEISAGHRGVGFRARSHQHDACAFERISLLALVQHQGHALVRQDVLGVQRQFRQQEERRAINCTSPRSPASNTDPPTGHQCRKCARTPFAQQLLGRQTGIKGFIGLH